MHPDSGHTQCTVLRSHQGPLATRSRLFAFPIAVVETSESGRSRNDLAWDRLLRASSFRPYKIKRARMEGDRQTKEHLPERYF